MLDGMIQQEFIHDAAAEVNLTARLHLHFTSVVDIGKVSRRRADIHHQHRMFHDVVSNLKMFGLAGRDKRCAGFGNHLYRRITDAFKNTAVTFAVIAVPSGRTADVETGCVIIAEKISAGIQCAEHAGGKTADILFDRRVFQKAGLEAKFPFPRFLCITCILTDKQGAVRQCGIGRNKTADPLDFKNSRRQFAVLFQQGDSGLRISKIKSIEAFHGYTPDTIPFLSRCPSLTSAGRIVSCFSPGITSK